MSGRIGPRILVSSDITKKVRKTSTIMYLLLAIWPAVSERCQQQLRFFERNKTAALSDRLSNAREKQVRIPHDAAAQYDRVRGEQVNQISEAKPKIHGLALHCRSGQLITFDSQFADTFRSHPCAVRIIWGQCSLEPGGHCRSRRQRFPTSPETTGADGTRWVEHLMANLGMCAFYPTIEPPIQNRSTANSGAYGHINQPRLVLARAPSSLSE